jgi:2-polyprenyl-6-methoxyphenol hydroxylase-like FAD-dependent oxidoreductase
MGDVIVCGGGACGLLTAMLMARSGHSVTVLERDPSPSPGAEHAWESWERRGVNQFRLPHFLLPAFRYMADRELPGLIPAMEEAGAVRFNLLGPLAPTVDLHGRYDAVTARRPIFESVVASIAEVTDGIRVLRGVALDGLVWGKQVCPGIPHVRGVRTELGEEVTGDLVVDAMGRRSPLQRWISADGHDPGTEEVEDSGFIYYGCHIHTGAELLGPIVNYYGSVAILALPADNQTAGVGFVVWSGDSALRALRNEAPWRAAMKLFPYGEHILAGAMVGDMTSMAGIEDRRRQFVSGGRPVATGVVSVADASAATNPSLGRGISLGFRHVVQLCDVLTTIGLDDPLGLVESFHEVTERDLGRWYESTIWHDRRRLHDMIAASRGQKPSHEPEWELFLRFMGGFGGDPVLGMRFVETAMLTETPNQVLEDPDIRSRLADLPTPTAEGPTRTQLLTAAST